MGNCEFLLLECWSDFFVCFLFFCMSVDELQTFFCEEKRKVMLIGPVLTRQFQIIQKISMGKFFGIMIIGNLRVLTYWYELFGYAIFFQKTCHDVAEKLCHTFCQMVRV